MSSRRRIETRRHQVWHSVDRLTPAPSEADSALLGGLGLVGMIQTTVKRGDIQRREQRFYVAPRLLGAIQFADAARADWQIENICTECSTPASMKIKSAAEPAFRDARPNHLDNVPAVPAEWRGSSVALSLRMKAQNATASRELVDRGAGSR